jgi:predicted MPP superfamily phosphohydrolase
MLAVFSVLDIYIWRGLKKTLKPKVFKYTKWFIPLTTILFFTGFMANLIRSANGILNANYFLNLMVGFSFGVFIAKLLIAIPFLIEDVKRYPIFFFKWVVRRQPRKEAMPERRRFVRNISLGLASVPFVGTIYGITAGKYNYQFKRVPLSFNNLPSSFNGLKVIQFSDFHAGSFDDYEAVKNGLAYINERKPDLILFTGDLVNNRAGESEPFIEMLKELKAPLGKFAILGNHDYGDYVPYESEQDRSDNMNSLFEVFKTTGFDLLTNENRQIEKNGEIIDVVGVENWGQDPFPQYGDLDKATSGLSKDRFTILLSHDPDHWGYEARDYPHPFDLTLSGHTHGAQFGVEIPGWEWSPVQYRYQRWMGLYHEKDQYLFVSKGFGFLGFPGRVGMSPEIIEFTLTKA